MDEKKVITLYENKNKMVVAAVDKIVVEIIEKNNSEKCQAVALFGASPLAGTTTTSIELAIAMAGTGRKTLLVDCDVRKNQEYKKLNDEIDKGLAEYLLSDNGQCNISEIIYKTNVERLSYIPCGSCEVNATRVMSSSRMENLIADIRKDYECVIFDLPSVSVVPDAQLLFKFVDGIVMLVALGETRKKQIKDAKRKLLPYADKYYGMIINKVEQAMYKRKVQDFGYYFVNKKGDQILAGNAVTKNYKKMAKKNRKAQEEK